jgi:hypothetical protein
MRLIDADALVEKSFCTAPATMDNPYGGDSVVLVEDIENAPTIDLESLIQYRVDELSRIFHYRVVKDKLEKQGEWKHFYGNRGQCSVCGVVVSSTVRNNGSYCPNCGAKMKGGNT